MTKPLVLVILDGWGYSEKVEGNAIAQANTPVWDRLWNQYPHALISGSGHCVGLPPGQMGNSEVGHLNMGAGRVVYQDFTRITKAIEDESFFENQQLTHAVDVATKAGKAVHILGLLSPGGVHSHEDHIAAMVRLAAKRGATNIYLHAFLDGRDTPPQSAKDSLQKIQTVFDDVGCGKVASIVGRYYAMDRDQRWDRVEQAYELLTQSLGGHAPDALTALQQAYDRGETDEFVKATAIGEAPGVIEGGDAVVFMNFRADRAREITQALTDQDFSGFQRRVFPKVSSFVMLTEYHADFDLPTAYPPEKLTNTLGEYLSKQGLTQCRLAETEKYAHVTFFFNGGIETPFEGEDRVLVPSPKVATYDLQPEMSAVELTDRLVEAIVNQCHDVIICNYANADMVGHTGVFDAAVKAIETIDVCLGRVDQALQQVGGEMLITADHGNAERMMNYQTGQPHTAHTSEPVPLIYVGQKGQFVSNDGKLSDVASTMLYLLDKEVPVEMTGSSLIQGK